MRRVGDFKFSRLGLGMWQAGEKGWGWGEQYGKRDILKALERAMAMGVNFFDTSEDYGPSEEILGEAIKKVNRDSVFIATKANKDHLRPDDMMKACEASRRRLGVDAIDLYQAHDPNLYVPIKETMKGFARLLRDGKIRYVGVSNFPVSMLKEAQSHLSRGEIVSNQVRYNLVQREAEAEIIPYCKKEKIGVIAFSPLAQGLLSGKYRPGTKPVGELRSGSKKPIFRDDNLRRMAPLFDELSSLARKYGVSVSQVSLSWLMDDPDVIPIPGFKSEPQVVENIGATALRLEGSERRRLVSLSAALRLSYYSDESSWRA